MDLFSHCLLFISSSSFYINCDRGLGLGFDTCGLGLPLVLGDMVLITSLMLNLLNK